VHSAAAEAAENVLDRRSLRPGGCDASDALRDRGTDLDGSVGNAARSALQGSHGQPEPTARLGGGRRRNDDPIEQTSYEANEPPFPRA